MSDCMQPWRDGLSACMAATGLSVPVEPNDGNYKDRVTICANPTCQALFATFRRLIAEKCEPILTEQARYPSGMWNVGFCPTTPAPTTKAPPSTPPPTTTKPPPPVTPPPTTLPPPAATPPPPVATPPPRETTTAPTTTSSPDSSSPPTPTTTTSPPTTTTLPPTAAPATNSTGSASGVGDRVQSSIGSPLPAPSVTTLPIGTPPPALGTQATSFSSTGTIVIGAGGSLFALAIVLLLLFFCRRRRRQNRENADAAAHAAAGVQSPKAADGSLVPYMEVSQARTADLTSTNTLPMGLQLRRLQISMGAIKVRQEPIAHGGFGLICRGTYKGRDVAVKRLLPERLRDPQNIKNFMDEIELTGSLKHAFLVEFIGAAWTTRTDLCMVTEFIDGGSLRTYLMTSYRPGHPGGYTQEKLKIAAQVAAALTYLHSRSPVVVHRDLKSLNILLTANRDAKLIDFGVSTEHDTQTHTAGVGTSLWMAPEVMLGRKYDEKADIFSFGVLLSELDTHQIPYSDVTLPRDVQPGSLDFLNLISVGTIKPTFTADADPDIVKLAEDCLSVDPTARPTAMEAIDRLRAVADGLFGQNSTRTGAIVIARSRRVTDSISMD